MLIIITYFIYLFVHMSVFPNDLKASLDQKLHLTYFYLPKEQYAVLNE